MLRKITSILQNIQLCVPVKLHGSIFPDLKKRNNDDPAGEKSDIANSVNNKAVSLFGDSRDITVRRNANGSLYNSESKLRTILENTNTAYILLNGNADIISFNLSAANLIQQEIKQTPEAGKNYIELMPYKNRGEIAKMIKSVFSTAIQKGHEVKIANNGKDKWLFVCMSPVFNTHKNVIGLSIAAVDITIEKNKQLEREKITDEIIQRNKDLEQFAYIISHNLRSPVTNIVGLSNLIVNETGLNKKDRAKCIKGLVQSVKKLDDVIIDLNYILQVRQEIGQKKEQVKFSAITKDIKTSINNLIEKQNISIKTDFIECNTLFTIKSYLHSIFYNIILNSIKYRRAQIPCAIIITAKKTNGKLTLRFKDNGLGIDMDVNRKNVFGLYKKFHLNIDGKGMGLYMTKTQVEMLGGTITLKSEVNKGTEIIIEFDDDTAINTKQKK